MKNKYLVLGAAALFSSLSFGQVEIHLHSDPGVNYNGDTVEVVSEDVFAHEDFYVVNPTGMNEQYKWRRVRLSMSNSGYTDQLCDDQLCFDCVGDTWTRPSFYTVAAGDSTLFQPKLNTNGISGDAHFRYYVINFSNVLIDSVDVKFTAVLGADDVQKVEYKLYPNPANTNVSVVLPEANSGDIQFVMYNMVGAEVMRKTMIQGTNSVSVESLQNGVYFYSIIHNNQMIETKKLIIKH